MTTPPTTSATNFWIRKLRSDDAETGRSHIKGMEEAARKPEAPLQLVDTVVAKTFEEWKAKALELSQWVDALFLPSMNTLHAPTIAQ